ncbi:unnamed protein product [Polarella glacialis]|uniref:Uncharacterized protein n=1 Tax=Polarella glacialis TaxID=89957 RepID=A0A813D9U3_POLGL|nr:unnamed protein product [Polarella glacialis]
MCEHSSPSLNCQPPKREWSSKRDSGKSKRSRKSKSSECVTFVSDKVKELVTGILGTLRRRHHIFEGGAVPYSKRKSWRLSGSRYEAYARPSAGLLTPRKRELTSG